MRLSCPNCHGEFGLDVLVTHQLARAAVARLVRLSLPFGALSLQYIALFKPASRGLSFDRIATLVEELRVDIERGFINRKGRDWAAPAEVWTAAIEVVLAKRDAGDLRLPLASHALLHEVMVGLVERAEAKGETQREADRRQQRSAGPRDALPRNLGALAADIAAGPTVLATTTPPADYSRPSRAALETRARIEAARRQREGATEGTDAADQQQEDSAP
ncbi:MAG: hypothetical protein RL375_3394 [Pseudomonadota bacterium]|jgi:hypothetical protein